MFLFEIIFSFIFSLLFDRQLPALRKSPVGFFSDRQFASVIKKLLNRNVGD